MILTMDVSRSMLATDVEPSRLVAAEAGGRGLRRPAAGAVPGGPGRLLGRGADRRPADHRPRRSCCRDREPPGRRWHGARRRDRAVARGGRPDAAAHGRPTPRRRPGRLGRPSASPAPDASAAPDPPTRDRAPARRHRAAVRRRELDGRARAARRRRRGRRGRRAGLHDRPRHPGRRGRRARTSSANCSQLDVPPDTETLAEIAEITGARFFEAPTAEDLAAIYESLGSKVGFTHEEQEVTQWFAAGALVLVLAGAGLAALWFNRIP